MRKKLLLLIIFLGLFLDCKKEKFSQEELEMFKKWNGFSDMCCVDDFNDYVKLENFKKIENLSSFCINFNSEKLEFDFIFHKDSAKDFSVKLDKVDDASYFILINERRVYLKYEEEKKYKGRILKKFQFNRLKDLSDRSIANTSSDSYVDENHVKHKIESKEDCYKMFEYNIIDTKKSKEETEMFQNSGLREQSIE